jgi:lipopolysaccharide transport system ATP-binding protein
MNEILVKLENASKKFCKNLKRSLWFGMKDLGGELLGRSHDSGQLRKDEFWAVKDISFELKRGECLGLIGPNGAGKTTLLRMLNGLIKPDKGKIEMHGRVGALIALGAGFNPILTGRENIYVNAAVLGLSKREIDKKINEIIDFAEINDFIDAPVQSYSSGMQIRLGFSVATALKPDVLLLDEVLAVGDAAFRNKCYRRIVSLRKNAAVIFVTHNMEQVTRICDHAMVLSKGGIEYSGIPAKAIAIYDNNSSNYGEDDKGFLSIIPPILDFSYVIKQPQIETGETVTLHIRLRSAGPMSEFLLRITLFNASAAFTADCNFSSVTCGIYIGAGENSWDVQLAPISLRSGCYRLSINIMDPAGDFVVWSHKQQVLKVNGGYLGAAADYQLQLMSWRKI